MIEQRRRASGMASFLMLVLVGLAAVPGLAAAQQPSSAQVSAIRASCRTDYQAHCSSIPSGSQASLGCLQQNMASLSPNCRQAVGAVGGGASPSSAAASGAPGAAAAAGAGTASAPAGRTPIRAEAGLLREECGADYRTHCRGVLPGGGRALACLADRRESLSHGCREAMTALRQR